MAIDLAPHGIRVNAAAPTSIETPMIAPFLANQEFRNQVIDKIKLGRLGRVEDLMGVVVFLASEAASLITGTWILMDGGWTAD
jgi:NAD(P)-dependent dehydrogenase (short-subunit alcohol dehydrogenase family)